MRCTVINATVINTTIAIVGAGLLVFSPMSKAEAGNLVNNGGFETGDFSGWTQSGNTDPLYTGVRAVNPRSGNYAAWLGPIGSLGYLSQSVSTIVGQSYQLSYFLSNDGRTPNQFEVSINGKQLTTAQNIVASAYVQHLVNFVGTGNDNLQFGFRHDPWFHNLDDVSVTPVPTPALLPGLIGMGIALYRKRKQCS
jgi:hypothetical protein